MANYFQWCNYRSGEVLRISGANESRVSNDGDKRWLITYLRFGDMAVRTSSGMAIDSSSESVRVVLYEGVVESNSRGGVCSESQFR